MVKEIIPKKIDIKTPPKLFKETQSLIKFISQNLEGDFISYWISSNSRIVGDDIVAFYEVLKGEPKNDNVITINRFYGGIQFSHSRRCQVGTSPIGLPGNSIYLTTESIFRFWRRLNGIGICFLAGNMYEQ